MTTLQCAKRGSARWCDGVDVKQVRLKSRTNIYLGDIVGMCAECRKANNGQFKMWPPRK